MAKGMLKTVKALIMGHKVWQSSKIELELGEYFQCSLKQQNAKKTMILKHRVADGDFYTILEKKDALALSQMFSAAADTMEEQPQ